MKSFPLKALCAALALVLLLPGCASDLPEEDETAILPAGSTLEEPGEISYLPEIFSLPYDPAKSLEPVTAPEGMQQTAASLLYEGLFRLDEHFTPQPWLCQHYTYDPETFRYTFTLRPGVLFSDGTELTAADVKATLDRARTSERYAQRFSAVTAITARDLELTITLSRPNTSFPALLDIPIVKKGTEAQAVPTGTGPYFFSAEESGCYLIASQSWWRGETQPTERIALVEADGHDAMLYRFTSRDVQLITADLTGSEIISLTGDVDRFDAATTVLQYVGVNTARLTSPALRSALSQGIDREIITQAYLSGHAAAAQFPVSPASPLYPKDLEKTYSFENFLSTLAQCDLPSRTLTMLVNEENSFKVSIAKFIAQRFTAAGLSVEVSVLPWEAYLAELAAGRFDLYYGEVRLTADWDLTALTGTLGTLNYGGWSNEETDRLLAAYAAGEDPAVSMEALCTHLTSQAPILPVCFKSLSVICQSEVLEGLSPTVTHPFFDLSEIRMHLKEN